MITATQSTTIQVERDELPRPFRFTVSDVLKMDAAGIFDDEQRIELIAGEIVVKPPIGPGHAGDVDILNAVLIRILADRAWIRAQHPLVLEEYHLPQPDIAVVRRRDDYYRNAHPTPADVFLVIEVADTTLRSDRQMKGPLYARAGIPEYWIVDVRRRQIEVYRDPAEDGYESLRTVRSADSLDLVALPGVTIAVSELLGSEPASRP